MRSKAAAGHPPGNNAGCQSKRLHFRLFFQEVRMKVYNDLTRQKEELTPQKDGEYKIYVCGPTVYDFFHLGNARPFIVYDTLRRYLEYCGNKVNYVQNFTDIDDKIIRRAHDEGISCQELAEKMIGEYFVDAEGLNIKKATVHPRATECIPDIIELIKLLEKGGYAYVIDDGVYFDTAAFPNYGKLSGHQPEEVEETVTRVAHSAGKRHQNDFALWKFKKEGEPFWESPWGEGRPGWHIECSAMSRKYLGDTLDIHGGGIDLLFPHHENEVAQSEAATGKPFVRYWMHNGFINVDHEKMSKSLGNFFTIRDLVKRFPYQIIRFFVLQAHYRMPINFSDELLKAAESAWARITTCASNLQFRIRQASTSPSEAGRQEVSEAVDRAVRAFKAGMDDDLNTADAIAAIFDLVRDLNAVMANFSDLSSEAAKTGLDTLVELCGVLGLEAVPTDDKAVPDEVSALVERRALAKKEKRWQDADAIRDEITALGWRVEDTAQGARLYKI